MFFPFAKRAAKWYNSNRERVLHGFSSFLPGAPALGFLYYCDFTACHGEAHA